MRYCVIRCRWAHRGDIDPVIDFPQNIERLIAFSFCRQSAIFPVMRRCFLRFLQHNKTFKSFTKLVAFTEKF